MLDFQAWQDLFFNGVNQAMIDDLIDDHEGLSIQRIHPIIDSGAQTELLAGDIVFG